MSGSPPTRAGSRPPRLTPTPTTTAAAVAGTSLEGDPGTRALAFVLRTTAARPQTEAEVADKLRDKGVDDRVAAAVLARARQLGAVDDAAFARAWVEDRGRRRGYGVARLREELRRRRVPEPLIEDAVCALADRDDLALATELARERARRLPTSLQPEAVARRLLAFLVRRGYPPGLAQRAAIAASGLDRAWD